MTPAARWFVSSLYHSLSLSLLSCDVTQLVVCKHIYLGFCLPGSHVINLFTHLKQDLLVGYQKEGVGVER